MNVLGITGLGVDPAACIVQDGKLTVMVQEERLNRIKGSFGLLPEKATRFCLSYAKLVLDQIDYIVFPWDADLYRFYMPYFFFKTYLKRSPKIQTDSLITKLEELLKYSPGKLKNTIAAMLRKIGARGRIPPIKFMPHHLAHAASTFYCSGFDAAYILVIDGSGEDKCTTIFRGQGLDIKEKKCFRMPDSLGWFYNSITEFLGFLPNRDEGKTMALAAYGKYNEQLYSKLKNIISFNDKGDYRLDASYNFLGQHDQSIIYSKKMVNLLKDQRHYSDPIQEIHMNIAFAAQDMLEKIVTSMIRNISDASDYNKKICIAGGVGQNCKMNGILAAQDYVDEIFIPPVSNDAGSALGAALYFSKENGFDPRCRMEHAYWGPDFSDSEIKQLLSKIGIDFKESYEIEKTVAELLSQDKVCGWFQGRMEIGPRALGSRSILANPAKVLTKDRVNKLKNREYWRPFAPSILYEVREEYLEKSKESPFMALSFKASKIMCDEMQAVVHSDNTTRPHLVKKELNPRYWKLINEFKNNSGIPAVLNTSFNINTEPIVCTPEEAIRSFYASELDYLAIGNFIVSKRSRK